MQRILNRYTYGASRPILLPLSPPDMAKLRVNNSAVWDEARQQWGPMMFSGVEVTESKWAEQHEPLAVVRDVYAKG